jgi:uncharacterized RDD family membrane protein YckC
MLPDDQAERGVALLVASPLQRLAAALLDLVFLVLADAVLLLLCLTLFPTEKVGSALTWAATPFSILYLVLFWARGQTPGKWLLGVKIVRPDGNPPGMLRAALRFVGYIIASLPLKIGLLAILWDEQGKGWHDHIAGTLVVRAGAAGQPSRAAAGEEPVEHESVRGGLRWSDAGMLALFALAAVVLTWPAFAHLPHRFPSNGGDADLFVWDLWWARKAFIEPGVQMFQTDYLFWPQTISLRLHSFSVFNCTLGVPLQSILSPVMAYSVLVFLALTLTSWAAYLLGKFVTGSRACGVLVGLVFGFSPYMIWHGFGHLNLISSEFAVAYVVLLVVLLKNARVWAAVGAGAALALAVLCNWYHLVHLAVFTAAFVVAWLLVHRRGILRRVALLAAAHLLALALLAPWIVPMAREFTSGRYRSETAWAKARAQSVSLDLCSLLVPPPYHAVFGRWTKPVYAQRLGRESAVEQAGYLGWGALALAAVALWDRRRRRAHMPWFAGALVCLVLSFGLGVHVCGTPGLPLWLGLILGGPPGSGTELPVVPSAALSAAWGIATGSPEAFTAVRHVDMPLAWLWNVATVTRLGSVPARFIQIAYLCLAVLAAVGALRISQMARQRWGLWASRAALWGAGAVVVFEYLVAPRFPTDSARVHPFYERLARDRNCTAILEVPVWSVWHPCFQRAQTVHGKRLYRGFAARVPDGAERFLRARPLLSEALAEELTRKPTARVRLGLASQPDAVQVAAYREDLRALAETGCCYILLHKDRIQPGSLRAAEHLLGDDLGLAVVCDDERLRVYCVPRQTAR